MPEYNESYRKWVVAERARRKLGIPAQPPPDPDDEEPQPEDIDPPKEEEPINSKVPYRLFRDSGGSG